jgi:Ca-activated chloride channel family protein
MNRRIVIRNLLMTAACSLLSRDLRARKQNEQNPPDFTLRSESRLVLLDVSVTDRDGNPVTTLKRSNFAVLENGRPQTISVFAPNDAPATVGILVDESGSMQNKRTDVLMAAETFINESNREDEMFLLNFNDSVTRALPAGTLFSSNQLQLREALLRGVPKGKTALNDAIAEGVDLLRRGTRERKAIVVISDGGDNASLHTAAQIQNTLESRFTTVYAIGLYDEPAGRDANPGFLKRLAKSSGGHAYFPKTPAESTAICRAIAKDIRSRYTLGYVPEAGPSGELRHIVVHAVAAGTGNLNVHTRSGYRFEKEPDDDQP